MIVITGPTASGKSALAVDIAQRLSTEIISADSRQIYRGIPIVTAQPTPDEMGGIKHHLLNTLSLEQYYSASMFEQDALRIASELFKKHETIVVCGGSMMYIDALCNGIDELPTVSAALRQRLGEEHKEKGDAWLLEELQRHDPIIWEKIDHKNIKRVFHALEISIQAGQPYSSLLGKNKTVRPFRIIKIFLDLEREILFDRINRRVDKMVEQGLEQEIRNVAHLRDLNSLNTVGVKEMFDYFDGRFTFGQAIERIKKNTRVYAKKQTTWFSRDPDILKVNPEEAIDKINRLL